MTTKIILRMPLDKVFHIKCRTNSRQIVGLKRYHFHQESCKTLSPIHHRFWLVIIFLLLLLYVIWNPTNLQKNCHKLCQVTMLALPIKAQFVHNYLTLYRIKLYQPYMQVGISWSFTLNASTKKVIIHKSSKQS